MFTPTRSSLICFLQCIGGSLVFLLAARGDRLFGGDTAEFE